MFFKRARRSKNIVNIRVDRLFPSSFSPRRDFDGEDALCECIRENGVTEPLTVKLLEKGKYSVISGERRLRAAKAAGLTRVPALLYAKATKRRRSQGFCTIFPISPLTYLRRPTASIPS